MDISKLQAGDTVIVKLKVVNSTSNRITGCIEVKSSSDNYDFETLIIFSSDIIEIQSKPIEVTVGTTFSHSDRGSVNWTVVHILDGWAWCTSGNSSPATFSIDTIRDRIEKARQ